MLVRVEVLELRCDDKVLPGRVRLQAIEGLQLYYFHFAGFAAQGGGHQQKPTSSPSLSPPPQIPGILSADGAWPYAS